MSYLTVSNCTFVSNSSKGLGGAIRLGTDVDSTFIGNRATGSPAGDGGAIGLFRGYTATAARIQRCEFIQNRAKQHGGAIGFNVDDGSGNILVDDCTFTSNSCQSYGGSGLYITSYDTEALTARVVNCKFVGGVAEAGYGALESDLLAGSTATVENCEFYGNTSLDGTLAWTGAGTGTVKNGAFVGNNGGQGGGGLYVSDGGLLVENCTVVSNYAVTSGGMLITNAAADVTVRNSIIYGNAGGAQVVNYDADSTIAYSDIQGGVGAIGPTGVTDGDGNINEDPRFAGVAKSGNWTVSGAYDLDTGKTTLTDAGAGLTAGELLGMTVLPDTANAVTGTKYLQFLVCSNSTTTITVWGNAGALATNDAPYQVSDWHLASTGGRWTPGDVWVLDSHASPCVDSGDPDSVYPLETDPDGGQINMGFYGNTLQASRKPPGGTVVMVR